MPLKRLKQELPKAEYEAFKGVMWQRPEAVCDEGWARLPKSYSAIVQTLQLGLSVTRRIECIFDGDYTKVGADSSSSAKAF